VWSEKSTNLISMTAPLVVLSVPLLDAGLAIGRRYIRQQPIFRADRAHIHHKMLARGLAPHHVVFILYGFCGLAAAAALLLTAVREQYHGFVVVIVCLAGWLGLQHLGYNEFGVAGQLAASGAFRGLLNAQLMLSEFEQELTESTTLEQCWDVLCSAGPQFGFSGIELNLDGTVLGRQVSGGWHVRIDLPGHGHITLTRQPGATDRGDSAVFFIDLISRVFLQKLNILKSDQHELTPYA